MELVKNVAFGISNKMSRLFFCPAKKGTICPSLPPPLPPHTPLPMKTHLLVPPLVCSMAGLSPYTPLNWMNVPRGWSRAREHDRVFCLPPPGHPESSNLFYKVGSSGFYPGRERGELIVKRLEVLMKKYPNLELYLDEVVEPEAFLEWLDG